MHHAPPTVATQIYHACLFLYPSAFRLEFGNEMVNDFEDATHDAWDARGWIGVLALWTLVAADLVGTIVMQWLRTGLPALVLLSAIWSTMMCTLIAQQFGPRSPAVPVSPPPSADDEVKIMLVVMGVLVWVIAAVIVVTGWSWMLVLRRKKRRS